MASLVAQHSTTGVPVRREDFTAMVTGPSVMPAASLDRVLPVQGHTTMAEFAEEIHIGSNVWLACNVVVLGGVHIGNNVVIGAGSVVTKDIPDNYLAFGNPCRPVPPITQADSRQDLILEADRAHFSYNLGGAT